MGSVDGASPLLASAPDDFTVRSLLESVNKHVKASGGEAMLQTKDNRTGEVSGSKDEKDMELADFKLRTATNAKIVAALTPEQKIVWSCSQKNKGNEYYKRRNYEGAIKKYMDALVALDLSLSGDLADRMVKEIQVPVLCNLAACYVHTKSWSRVEPLCTEAIKLDSSCIKAYTRRAQARAANHEFASALRDLKIADTIRKGCCDKLIRKITALKIGHERRSKKISEAYKSLLESEDDGLYGDKVSAKEVTHIQTPARAVEAATTAEQRSYFQIVSECIQRCFSRKGTRRKQYKFS